MTGQRVSEAVEHLLVARNPRNMALARRALRPGYYLRGARHLYEVSGTVIIGTGFPVADTFETDGPAGAMALYGALEALGARPVIACGAPLAQALAPHYRVLELESRNLADGRDEALRHLSSLRPEAVVAIERPGLAGDGRYYNMRGEDISDTCHCFDPFVSEAGCPTIAIGDGGNEIGMGNIAAPLSELDIRISVTPCDELLVADVSNWGAYGLIAMLAVLSGRDLLHAVYPGELLQFLTARGGIDGVTRRDTPTEDGLEAGEGLGVIRRLRELTNFP